MPISTKGHRIIIGSGRRERDRMQLQLEGPMTKAGQEPLRHKADLPSRL